MSGKRQIHTLNFTQSQHGSWHYTYVDGTLPNNQSKGSDVSFRDLLECVCEFMDRNKDASWKHANLTVDKFVDKEDQTTFFKQDSGVLETHVRAMLGI